MIIMIAPRGVLQADLFLFALATAVRSCVYRCVCVCARTLVCGVRT